MLPDTSITEFEREPSPIRVRSQSGTLTGTCQRFHLRCVAGMDFQETIVIPLQFATDTSASSAPQHQRRLFSRRSADLSTDESRLVEHSFLPLHSERIQRQIHRIEPIRRTISVHHGANRTGLDAIIRPADDPNLLEPCRKKRNQVPVDPRYTEIRFAAQMICSRLRRLKLGSSGSPNRVSAGAELSRRLSPAPTRPPQHQQPDQRTNPAGTHRSPQKEGTKTREGVFPAPCCQSARQLQSRPLLNRLLAGAIIHLLWARAPHSISKGTWEGGPVQARSPKTGLPLFGFLAISRSW